ncbi:hypothetical protein A33Q_1176 [Indibacter alkaliphilus LW1]|jgi:hypothetical protein|uniref:DUF2490 domain-containing protein n=1 Tax=Indibacter alkaliphilus (strain CCUG 57479 / KCTC 22604 / LW1) TaxID=1189612 RepID=S2DHN2_INDAL|nr:DUF2490 domain-containing protein [Indibacter alkaliphilus]EOZ98522.1 hypothetical protein A33Q_1176 [Indibacter alkaliphilus LW1]
MKKLLIFISLFFFSLVVRAQREIRVNPEMWWGLMSSGQIAPNWSLWLDTHHVPDLFLIVRSGLTLHTQDQRIALTAGYARLGLTTPFSEGRLIRPENRPWGQIVYRLPSTSKFSTSLRYRHDMRYRANFDNDEIIDGFGLNHRMRFNVSFRYNWGEVLDQKFNFATTLFNESLVTVGPSIADNPFEHRVFALFSFSRRAVTVSPGYHLRLATPNPETLRINHGPFLWVTINYRLKNFRRHLLREFPGDHI